MAIDKTGRHTMADILAAQFNRRGNSFAIGGKRNRNVEAAAQQVGLPAGKAMAGKRMGIAADATLARRYVAHQSGGRHVTRLTLLALGGCRTFPPFTIGSINVNAEYHSLMTGSAITALLVQGGIS